MSVVRDITERRKAEENLRKSEQFLSGVFKSIQDGIVVLDPDLTIRHANSTIEKWYAQNLPLVGKKCYEAFLKRDKPCEQCPSLRCIKSGQLEREIVPGPPGSSVEWIELFSYPIKDPDSGEVTGVVEFVRDVTERKKAEEELEKYRSLLEEQVKERTAELEITNAELKRINNLFVGREIRMADLKKQIEELKKNRPSQ